MSKPNNNYYGKKGASDKEAGRAPRPPHGTISSTFGSLFDGKYEKRDSENKSYWDSYNKTDRIEVDDDD